MQQIAGADDLDLRALAARNTTPYGEFNIVTDPEAADIVLRLAAAVGRRTDAERRRDEALAEIAKELEFKTQARAPLAGDLPSDLVTLYEKIRAQQGGVGAAELKQRRCGGCRLELNNVEIGRLRDAPEDEVLRCEECRRILVRTAESGL